MDGCILQDASGAHPFWIRSRSGAIGRKRVAIAFNVESIERRLLLRACVGVYIVRAHGLSAVSSALQRIHPCCCRCCCCCNTRAPPSPQCAKHQPQSAREKKNSSLSLLFKLKLICHIHASTAGEEEEEATATTTRGAFSSVRLNSSHSAIINKKKQQETRRMQQ